MTGEAELDDMISALERVPAIGAGTVEATTPLIRAEAQRTAAAGTTPDGEPWAPKKDGTPALVHASSAVEVSAIGNIIETRLVGNATAPQRAQAIQNFGSKRIPARPIIPVSGTGHIPDGYQKALEQGAGKAFRKVMGAA